MARPYPPPPGSTVVLVLVVLSGVGETSRPHPEPGGTPPGADGHRADGPHPAHDGDLATRARRPALREVDAISGAVYGAILLASAVLLVWAELATGPALAVQIWGGLLVMVLDGAVRGRRPR